MFLNGSVLLKLLFGVQSFNYGAKGLCFTDGIHGIDDLKLTMHCCSGRVVLVLETTKRIDPEKGMTMKEKKLKEEKEKKKPGWIRTRV